MAIAEAFVGREKGNEILFIGTEISPGEGQSDLELTHGHL
jgi:hypothetical protein